MRFPAASAASVRVWASVSVLVLALPALAAEQAGVSAAVRGQVALNRPQTVGRQVAGGEPILLEDALTSGPRSGMQILLLDETVFTIGPDSQVVIDEFVYDPRTNAGKLGAEVTKGVFRFVSGKIAHENPSDMNVKLPSGTIGVRGTMVAGRTDPVTQKSTVVLLGEGVDNDTGSPAGAFVVCNAGECVRVNRPGFATTIEGPGAGPSAPFRLPLPELDALTQAVSDPQGWVETATSGGAAPADVAAGPPGAQDTDPRSASDVSGESTAATGQDARQTRERFARDTVLDQATVLATQSGPGGRCGTIQECTGVSPSTAPIPVVPTIPTTSNATTFDELTALAATGLQSAVYQRSEVGLVTTSGISDGSYNFSLVVNLGSQTADLQVSNLSSSSLGISGQGFGQRTSYAEVPPGLNLPAAFGATGILSGELCGNGCTAAAGAVLQNGNGRVADSVIHAVTVTPPSQSVPAVPAVVTNPSDVQIRRP